MNKNLAHYWSQSLIFWSIVAALAYAALYWALVVPTEINVTCLGGERYTYAHYKIEGDSLETFFGIANQIDRILRPTVWDTYNCTAPSTGPLSMRNFRYPGE